VRRLAGVRRPSHASRDRWLVSYADFMTLLFAFFATMYAISSVDARKLSTVATALQTAFDASVEVGQTPVTPEVRTPNAPAPRRETAPPADAPSLAIERAVAHDLASELASERLQLFVDHRGVTLSIPEAGTFAVGRDEVSIAAQALVARVAVTLNRFPDPVRVEGHTDDVPIHNLRFQSNWDLSAARASRVVELLIGEGLAPDRLSATGYGEFHPRVANGSAETRAQNRRIDLVVLNAATTTAEEPAAAGQTP
jgi:chemotaxis protein MotB